MNGRVTHVDQGVAHRKHFAAFGFRQQFAKRGLDHNVDNRIGEVERHQKQEKQPQVRRDAHTDEAHGEETREAQDQSIAGNLVSQVTAVKA